MPWFRNTHDNLCDEFERFVFNRDAFSGQVLDY
jgi:hypothetical protein